MAIKIGTAVSRRRPESYSVTPDDRQELIKTIDGVVVLDFGRIDAGDVIGFTTVFDAENWALVEGYWRNRTLVTLVDEAGVQRTCCRIRITSYTYVERFEKKRYKATLEVWQL